MNISFKHTLSQEDLSNVEDFVDFDFQVHIAQHPSPGTWTPPYRTIPVQARTFREAYDQAQPLLAQTEAVFFITSMRLVKLNDSRFVATRWHH